MVTSATSSQLPVPTSVSFIPMKSGALAIVLALLIPGAGQIYAEHVVRGVIVLLVTMVTIVFVFGLVLWIYGIVDAYLLVKKWNESLERDPYVRPW